MDLLKKAKKESVRKLIKTIWYNEINNNITNKSSLVRETFIPEMHLMQPGYTCLVSGPFTKQKERIWKFKEIEDSKNDYRSELDKIYF